jgi:uncharacterized DUF497 family protein
MEIVWDPDKALSNYNKHGVRFSDAESVLYDPLALTIEDEDAEGEQRFVSLGTDLLGRIIVVVYTYRSNQIRLISARTAEKNEIRSYEKGI